MEDIYISCEQDLYLLPLFSNVERLRFGGLLTPAHIRCALSLTPPTLRYISFIDCSELPNDLSFLLLNLDFPELRVIDHRETQFFTASSLLRNRAHLSSLRHLCLSVDYSGIDNLAHHFKNLSSVKFSPAVSMSEVKEFLKMLQHHGCRILSLHGVNATPKEQLLVCPLLQTISIIDIPHDYRSLFNEIHQSKVVHLLGRPVPISFFHSAHLLSVSLFNPFPLETPLYDSSSLSQTLQNLSITSEPGCHWGPFIRCCKSLVRLSLRGGAYSELMEMISNELPLSLLRFSCIVSDFPIDQRHCQFFSSFFRANPSVSRQLTSLELVSVTGFPRLMVSNKELDVLAQFSSLQELDLRHVAFPPLSYKQIFKFKAGIHLTDHVLYSLHTLSLCDCDNLASFSGALVRSKKLKKVTIVGRCTSSDLRIAKILLNEVVHENCIEQCIVSLSTFQDTTLRVLSVIYFFIVSSYIYLQS
ncbi:hypothetical protein GEMRC1_004804 [Eukaryota sp. GEM-RC1]